MERASLVRKLRDFQILDDHLEQEQTSKGGIARHDLWRRRYYNDPYLAILDDQDILERFFDIFQNLHTLTNKGQISPIQPLENADYWFSKFTEILEETNARAILTAQEIRKSRSPILKYFLHTPPRGVRMFSNYTPPAKPFLVKFGKYEHLIDTMRDGIIRLTPAHFYSGDQLNDAIRDDELVKTFFLPTLLPYLMDQPRISTAYGMIVMKDRKLAIHIKYPRDYYMYCLTNRIENRLVDDFGADSALIIKDKFRFLQNFDRSIAKQYPDLTLRGATVSYFDPYREFNKSSNPQFMKHFRYFYQSEYRITAEYKNTAARKLEPVFLKLSDISEYCEIRRAD